MATNYNLTGLYTGSFDPPTIGHIGVVGRALTKEKPDTLKPGYIDHLVICVVESDVKERFLTKENAAALFTLSLPPEFKGRVSIETIPQREAVAKHKATVRVKGVRTEEDIDFESTNIRKGYASAATRATSPLDVIWIMDDPAPTDAHIASTKVRDILFDPEADKNQLYAFMADNVATLLIEVSSEVAAPHNREADSWEIYTSEFNRVLKEKLSQLSQEATAILTPPPISKTSIGSIQKEDGHLHDHSIQVLEEVFGSYAANGTHNVFLKLPEKEAWATIRVDSMSDIIPSVSKGFVDWAIVSNDAAARWQGNNGASGMNSDDIEIVTQLGPSGCRWMLMKPEEDQALDWRQIIADGQKIVTSQIEPFHEFLRDQGMDPNSLAPDQVIEQKGSTERFARDLRDRFGNPILVFDKVATGKTAFKHHMVPEVSYKENQVVLIRARQPKGDVLQTDAICAAIVSKKAEINQRLVELYAATLSEELHKSATRPAMGNFLAVRVQEVLMHNFSKVL